MSPPSPPSIQSLPPAPTIVSAPALPWIVSLPKFASITTFVPTTLTPRRSIRLAASVSSSRTVPVAPLPSICSMPLAEKPRTPMSTLPVPMASMRSTPLVPVSL